MIDVVAGLTVTSTCGELDRVTRTVADALALEKAALEALTVTVVLDCTEGAVRSPLEVIEPALAVHITAVLVVPFTDAVNWTWPPEATDVLAGESVIDTLLGGVTRIETEPLTLESEMLIAVTVMSVLRVTDGAVNKPVLVIDPALAVHLTAADLRPACALN